MTEAIKGLVVPIVLAKKSTMKTACKQLIQLWQKNGILQRMGV